MTERRTAVIHYCWEHNALEDAIGGQCVMSEWGTNQPEDCDITQAAIAEILPYATYEETTITDQPARHGSTRNTNPMIYTTADMARLDELT